jgi:adenosylmethionine-8-amino-7-oxononanoate aminotransferase
VGHCHPYVTDVAIKQMKMLNTNTRYLDENLGRYAERLTSLFPSPLSVVFFVNSGSEANDLAMRLAKAATGGTDMISIDSAYHGHTQVYKRFKSCCPCISLFSSLMTCIYMKAHAIIHAQPTYHHLIDSFADVHRHQPVQVRKQGRIRPAVTCA